MGSGDGREAAGENGLGRRVTRGLVERGARDVGEDDIRRVVRKAEAILARFRRGPLARFLDDGRLLVLLVKDYWSGEYRDVPWATLAAVVFTLLYVLNPFDLVPDFLPGIGQMDDAAVLSLVLFMVENDLERYRRARAAREDS